MIKLNVGLQERSYSVYISNNYSGICEYLKYKNKSCKFVIVTDTNVDYYQSEEFIKALSTQGYNTFKYVIDAGEKSKNLDTVNDIYKFLLDLKVDRNDVLIALGGGVVGDTAGFVAATFLRGIEFVQVPTTLLAQVDSSIGGKVGVNFSNIKNIIGAFYQPKFVYINTNSLKTLPIREVRSGMAEVIVHCIIDDIELFDYIDSNLNGIFQFENDILEHTIRRSCLVKISIVEQDEKEKGMRAILNFGHTIGHAIESVYNFKLLHGECVSIGMVGAFRIAQHLGMIDNMARLKVINILKKINLPYYLEGLNVEKVFHQMFFDKKIYNNILTFVLPVKLGQVVKYRVEDAELVKKVLNELSKVSV